MSKTHVKGDSFVHVTRAVTCKPGFQTESRSGAAAEACDRGTGMMDGWGLLAECMEQRMVDRQTDGVMRNDGCTAETLNWTRGENLR